MATRAFVRRMTAVQSLGDSANGHGPRLMTIGEIARRSGFTVKALRFYDGHGVLPPCRRQPSGYRLYSESDLRRLEFIRQAKVLGLTLDAIVLPRSRDGGASASSRWRNTPDHD